MNKQRRIVRALTGGIVAGALLLGVHATPLVAGAEETTQAQTAPLNRALAGARNGLLTQAKGSLVQIDHTTYVLAPGARVETKYGQPWPSDRLTWDGVEFVVHYWLGTGAADRQITQLIIHFPE